METYRIENLSFAYPSREENALHNINLTVNQGEFITLCGTSGCGKTTLLRLLKPIISPHGVKCGSILFCGREVTEMDAKEQASKIGYVMQSPDNQLVTDKVWHELAFGLESMGLPIAEIRARVSEMAAFFGIDGWFYKSVTELSGGQKQILNLASVMVMQPKVLILDEPTSQLDPIAAEEFFGVLEKINRELGITVILSEHRLENAFAVSDRVIVMDGGKILMYSSPCRIGKKLKEIGHPMLSALPAPMRIYTEVEDGEESPVSVRDGRVWFDAFTEKHALDTSAIPRDFELSQNEVAIEIKDAWFRYEKNLPDVIKGLSLTVQKGEFLTILGGNGTGKTTTLSLLCGLGAPYRGKICVHGTLGALPQNVQTLFTKKTVYADLCEMTDDKERIALVSELCRITDLLEFHPYDLSGGEQQRAALAKVLLLHPDILLLDEPTKGMDAQFKEEFAMILQSLKNGGVTVVMVSHDIEFCAEYADRCALFFDGNITSAGTPREFFAGKNFYTTSVNRMVWEKLPRAILLSDILAALGRKVQKKSGKKPPVYTVKEKSQKNANEQIQPLQSDKKLTKRTLYAMLAILVLIPLTVFVGVYYLGDRKYYFISLLIILETLIPFCMVFEGRKPQARELVVISVLCAIGVAGRAAFFMLPQFKPVTAIVIIAAVCFGGETGFLVGALTGFVSNFFFGQGPWTPWQMFAFGIIGFLAGVLAKKGLLRKSKLPLCIFGFVATLVIYGGIMNPASVLIWQATPKVEMFVSASALGLPFDLIHATSTAFFLFFAAEPMIEKLNRIKIKYGIVER